MLSWITRYLLYVSVVETTFAAVALLLEYQAYVLIEPSQMVSLATQDFGYSLKGGSVPHAQLCYGEILDPPL